MIFCLMFYEVFHTFRRSMFLIHNLGDMLVHPIFCEVLMILRDAPELMEMLEFEEFECHPF